MKSRWFLSSSFVNCATRIATIVNAVLNHTSPGLILPQEVGITNDDQHCLKELKTARSLKSTRQEVNFSKTALWLALNAKLFD
jgi:hypothetical protein